MRANPIVAGNTNHFLFWFAVVAILGMTVLAGFTMLAGFVFDPGWKFDVFGKPVPVNPESYLPLIFLVVPLVFQYIMARNRPEGLGWFDLSMTLIYVSPVVLAILSWAGAKLWGYAFAFTPYAFFAAVWIVVSVVLDTMLFQFGGLGFDDARTPAPRAEHDPLAPPARTPHVEEQGSRDVTIRIGVQVNGENIVLENAEGRELLPRP